MRSFSGDFLHISYEKIEEKEMVEKTNNTTYTLFIFGELLLLYMKIALNCICFLNFQKNIYHYRMTTFFTFRHTKSTSVLLSILRIKALT